MNFQRLYPLSLHCWRPQYFSQFSNVNNNEFSMSKLCNYLNISENVAHRLCLKHPVVKKLNEDKLKSIIKTLHELGLSKEILLEEPSLLSVLPVTLRFRFQVLKECGVENIKPGVLVSYLPIVKKETIGDLKKAGVIPSYMNTENRLASYMTQWPTSLTTSIWGDVNYITLYSLRLKIIQRYLELVLDLSMDEFYRGIQTYPTIKHRPLKVINETLNILQSQVMMPNHKIKSNLYLVHADPENLKNVIYNFRSIGGIDIKEVIRMHPKVAMKNYATMIEIRKILKEYGISNEAQIRCFDIYTLGSRTVRERLEKAKGIPEFSAFFNHPRFLKMIHYNKTAMKRLNRLYSNNKKCLSLNILSGSSAHYETFEKAPGDRLGKGKDLLFCISQSLGGKFHSSDIRNLIKRHPFWINIPLVQVKYVYQQLTLEFTANDIYENCPILLYPWSKIKDVLNVINNKKLPDMWLFNENLYFEKLSKSQKLSLVLYALEKNHYFSGNGVWTEEKIKNIEASQVT